MLSDNLIAQLRAKFEQQANEQGVVTTEGGNGPKEPTTEDVV